MIKHIQSFGPVTVDWRRVVAVFDRRRTNNGIVVHIEGGSCFQSIHLSQEDGADEFMADLKAFRTKP